MKKIFSIVLLVAMLAVALVSCNTPEAPTQDPANPADQARTTITAEEWAAACALENFTYEQKGTTVYTADGQTETYDSTNTCKRTANAYHYKSIEEGDPNYERYWVIEDGICYVLNMSDNGEVSDVHTTQYDLDNLSEELGFDDAAFESLVYNAETKAYDYSINEDGMDIKYAFYFENGTIVKIVASATQTNEQNESATMTINVTFSNLGTTTIQVPEFDKPTAE